MTTLTLSGWAQPADALAHLADDAVVFDYSDYASIEAAIDALKQMPHTQCAQCVAWSMGGVLALRAIAAGVIAPSHLTLIGVSAQFVQTPDYRHAMDPFTYTQFRDNYASQPARTKERFLALIAKGDRDARRVMQSLRHHPDVENTARWLPWLEELGAVVPPPIGGRLGGGLPQSAESNSAPLPASPRWGEGLPTLIIHGTEDAIVPCAQAQTLAEMLPNATVSLWQGVGHAPHIHDAERLRAEIAAHRKAYGV